MDDQEKSILSTTPFRWCVPIVLALKTEEPPTARNIEATKADENIISFPIKLKID